ncbi:MAG TPA: FAD-dependent oxidoreductase [Gemmatimonadaceae bacterium]|nr:FAD-dependent oxidoreductase [Gemmatimonadaceae bacterium]
MAILGGGVTGLACAHDLALLGHRPVIFERLGEVGGIVVSRLLAARVPTAAIRAEAAAIAAFGAEIRPLQSLDSPDTLDRLLGDGFDAVFLAIGASGPAQPLFPHDDTFGVHDASDLDAAELRTAKNVVVCGEGALALDASMSLAREEVDGERRVVHLVLESPNATPSLAMLSAARRAGVSFHVGWTPSRILRSTEDKTITGLELMSEDQHSVIVLGCQRIVTAARRVPRASFLVGLDRSDGGYVAVDPETLRTSRPRVWAGGACAFGHRSIAHAIADGKRAAWSIHASVTGTRVRPSIASAWIEVAEERSEPTSTALATKRMSLPLFDGVPADPFSGEATSGLTESAKEASRCFDCTIAPVVLESCTGCGKCVKTCKTGALRLEGEPTLAVVEQDRCTRCGDCVSSCPEGAIAIVRAVWENRLALEPEPSTMLGLLDRPPVLVSHPS